MIICSFTMRARTMSPVPSEVKAPVSSWGSYYSSAYLANFLALKEQSKRKLAHKHSGENCLWLFKKQRDLQNT